MSNEKRSSSTDTVPYEQEEVADPEKIDPTTDIREEAPAAEKTTGDDVFSPDFNPFSENFQLFKKFLKFRQDQCKSIDVNPPHNKDKRVIIKPVDKGRSNDRSLLYKDRSNDLCPAPPKLIRTRSNDSRVQSSTPRTNVNGELGCKNQSRSSSSSRKYSSSTITSGVLNKKRKDTDFVISEQRKKSRTSNIISDDADVSDDDDRISIPTQSDMDQRINELVGETSSEREDSPESDFNFEELRQDYIDDEEVGSPVDNKIASLFQSLKPIGLSKEKVLQKAKIYPRPKNCNLEVRQVNPEIWTDILSPKDRSCDLALQKVHKTNTKSTYAILKIAELAKAKNDNPKKVIKEILKCSIDAMAFSTTTNVQLEKIRRELILNRMAQDQRSIGQNINPDDKLLFGDNLHKKLQEAAGASKLKLKKPKFNQWNSYQGTEDPKNRFWSRKNPRDRKPLGYKKKYSTKKYKKSYKTKESSKKSD